MSFQLVRAGDSEIAVWNVDHGHIFTFLIAGPTAGLIPGPVRNAPDATQDATSLSKDALQFATVEARSRRLIR